MSTTATSARGSGSFALGGDLPVHRLGLGTMMLPGPGVWGPPTDHDEAVRVLRRAVELGITLLDTADSYGPHVAEELIAEALYPYPDDLVIATKAGLTRFGPIDGRKPEQWPRLGRPEYLRQQVEMSLRRLRLERIELFQLHRIDPAVPFAEQIGALASLREQGKIRHVGLSGVSVDELRAAREIVPVVSVQNPFNLSNRAGEEVLDHATEHGIGFIPFVPLAVGQLATPGGSVADVAARHDATPSQVALAWLLRRSPVMLPIPGTSKVAHLEENVGAATLELTDDEFAELTAAA